MFYNPQKGCFKVGPKTWRTSLVERETTSERRHWGPKNSTERNRWLANRSTKLRSSFWIILEGAYFSLKVAFPLKVNHHCFTFGWWKTWQMLKLVNQSTKYVASGWLNQPMNEKYATVTLDHFPTRLAPTIVINRVVTPINGNGRK